MTKIIHITDTKVMESDGEMEWLVAVIATN